MNERLYVKPARPGDIIRDPSHPNKRWSLPDEGASVPDNNFYRRRLNSGDVVLVETRTTHTRSSHVTKQKGE